MTMANESGYQANKTSRVIRDKQIVLAGKRTRTHAHAHTHTHAHKHTQIYTNPVEKYKAIRHMSTFEEFSNAAKSLT